MVLNHSQRHNSVERIREFSKKGLNVNPINRSAAFKSRRFDELKSFKTRY